MIEKQNMVLRWEQKNDLKAQENGKWNELFINDLCKYCRDLEMRIIKRQTEPLLCVDKLIELKEILLDKK